MPETDIHVKFWRNMLQAMTVVAMLRLLADGVEVPCNPARRGPGGSSNGGGIHFERVRGYTFKGNVPPFRKLPERDYGRRNESQIDELRMCQLLALGQGGAAGQGSGSQGPGSAGSSSSSPTSSSSSQQPSSRDVVAFVFTPGTYRNENFDPSMCEIFSSSVHGEGLMRIMARDPRSSKSLFNPLCLSSSRRADCRNRMYAFETQFQAGFDRNLADPPQKMPSREECADACLNSYNTVCRHAMYDVSSQDCYMSSNFSVEISYTPDMQDMIYMENACLTDERECPTEEGIGIEIKTAEELGYSPDPSGSSGLPDIDSRDRPRDRPREEPGLMPGLLLHPYMPRDDQRGSRIDPSGPRNRFPDSRLPPSNRDRDWDSRDRSAGRVSSTTMDECLAGCKRFEPFKCRTVIHYYERAGQVGRDGRQENVGPCLLTDMELTGLPNSDKMMLAEYSKRQGAEIKDHPCRRTRSPATDSRALDNQPVFGPGGRGYVVKENFVMIPGYKMESRGMEKSYGGSSSAQDCLEECLKTNNNRGRCEAISYSGIRRECYLSDESPRRARLIRDDDFQIYELKAATLRPSSREGGSFGASTPFDNRFYWRMRSGGPNSGGPAPPFSRDYFGQRGGAGTGASSGGGWRSGARDEWWNAGGREDPRGGRPVPRPWPSASDRDRDRDRDNLRPVGGEGLSEYDRNREVYERTRERNRGQAQDDRDKPFDDRRNGTGSNDGDNWRGGSNWVSTGGEDRDRPGRRDWWSSGSRWGSSSNSGWQSGSSGSRWGDRDRWYGAGGDQPVGGSPGDPQSDRWGSSGGGGGNWGASRDRDRWSDWRVSGNSLGASPGGSWGGSYGGGVGNTGVIGGAAGGGPYGWRNCDTLGAGGGAGSRRYQKMEVGYRLRRTYVDRYTDAVSVDDCMRLCDEEPSCRAFNYLADYAASGRAADNCQLSSRDERNLNDPLMFERDPQYDYFVRSDAAGGGGRPGGNCIDVTFSCDTEAMEFTLQTPDEFRGIIYTYNYYDRCYYQGKGDRMSVFRIPAGRGFQECGTRRYEDMMTNIVVVQFDERLLTTHDRKYNLTCRFSLDGETVVTSGYTQVSALPIEYLPAQYIDLLNVELRIMYNGRATNNIAVGDPLMFTLEARGSGYSFGYYSNDIFATNVIARDPYSGRSILLIDDRGCAVEPMIFPPLERIGDGRLQAYFEAFNIPEADFLVFEATVRPCRDGCPPARCTIYGREVPSWGRRRRDVSAAIADASSNNGENGNQGEEAAPADYDQYGDQPYPMYGDYYYNDPNATDSNTNSTEPPKHVMGVFRIYTSRDEIKDDDATASPLHVCIAPVEYRGLLATMGVLLVLLLGMAAFSGILYRKYRQLRLKHAGADSSSPYGYSMSGGSTSDRISTMSGISSQRSFGLSRPSNTRPTMAKACALPKPKLSFFSSASSKNNAVDKDDPYGLTIGAPPPVGNKRFQDPSEPIYADPSLFERSRSLRSVSPSDCGRIRQAPNMADSISTAYAAPSGCGGNSGDDD